MREIRLALLEADVNFKVVKQFTVAASRSAASARRCTKQLNPGQQVVKIVNEELTALMGGASRRAHASRRGRRPSILMAGLQGSGKTTATAKLARWLREERNSSGSPSRPATSTAPPRSSSSSRSAPRPARRSTSRARTATRSTSPRWALDQAQRDGKDVLIIDTCGPPAHRRGADGRSSPTSARRRRPHVVLLVVDAMTGQDAVNVAEQFAEVAAVRRRRALQARRRRPRRRRAVGQGGHRQADPVRLHGREARRLRALPPRPHGAAHPRHGRRPLVHREGRAARSTRTRRRRSSASCARTSSRSRTSSTS